MDGAVVDDHMIRIIPREPRYAGLLYTFLNSAPGQGIITRLMYGAVQQVIKAIQVEEIQVPLINDDLAELRARIGRAANLRAVASKAMTLVQQRLMELVRLPPPKPSAAARVAPNSRGEVIHVRTSNVFDTNADASDYRLDAHFYNSTAHEAVADIKACRSEVRTIGEVAERVLMGPRFKRNYVESTHGVPFLSGKNIVQIRPTDLKYLSNLQMADMQDLIVKRGWTLITCSGTIGRTCFVWENYEDYAASQHILRVIPDESQIDAGYLYAFLSSRYGYEQILRHRHGSVIDEVTDKQIKRVLVPCPPRKHQEAIGDMVREAYEKRAEAIRLEDEAQAILMNELTKTQDSKGV